MATDRFIATKLHAHKNGSHKGISPNKEFLIKISTPVLTKKYSETIMIKKPNIKTIISPFLAEIDFRKTKIIAI
jgi:hypothetical protein